MTWVDVLKRTNDDEVKEQILDVWRKMGFQLHTGHETIKGKPSILIQPKGKEPEGMLNRHFDFMEIVLSWDKDYGFLVKIPKEAPSLGKLEDYDVFDIKDAKRIGNLYLER
jgi:hypothetical protein